MVDAAPTNPHALDETPQGSFRDASGASVFWSISGALLIKTVKKTRDGRIAVTNPAA